jgi:subfamily B ATP-binding cassette protein MsbA
MMLVGQVCRLFFPFCTKYLLDDIVPKHQSVKLLWLAGAVMAATLVEALALFASQQMLTKLSERAIANLRTKVHSHILGLPVAYFDEHLGGGLTSRIVYDVESLRDLFGSGMLSFCVAVLAAVMTSIILMYRSWYITLILATVIFCAAAAYRRIFTYIHPLLREGSDIKAALTAYCVQSMAGIRVIKGYCVEANESSLFAQHVFRLCKNGIRTGVGFGVLEISAAAVLGITSAVVMLLGGFNLLTGSWTTGDYVQYSAMMFYMIEPAFQIVNAGTQFSRAAAGLDKLSDIFVEPLEARDYARTTDLANISGEISVDNVSFEYKAGLPVLHEITFAAHPGTVSAFVGSSGSGKSTLISLLCAFRIPTAGRVLVDGIDLSTVTLRSYRKHLGLVLQEPFLFCGTIRDNVLFSRPDQSEERFLEACRIARVDEFAERLPKSYDTLVGERGIKLSGGQCQRLSIARAILADPRVLILDEATSSLDSQSEAMIHEGLSYLMKGRTTFVIAHRLSTIRRADQIFVLEGGRIVECGTHESLYAQRSRYYDLYTQQYSVETNLFLKPREENRH